MLTDQDIVTIRGALNHGNRVATMIEIHRNVSEWMPIVCDPYPYRGDQAGVEP
jgi:hypothetical protein